MKVDLEEDDGRTFLRVSITKQDFKNGLLIGDILSESLMSKIVAVDGYTVQHDSYNGYYVLIEL